MSITAILLPVFVLVGLTFILLALTGNRRVRSPQAGEGQVADIALGERNWPKRALQFQNAFHNQFEMPILFYLLVAFALITRKADMLFVVMSWMFVASRLVHV